MASFEGKIVWITGASSGIGEALAEAFAQEGALLILSARKVEQLEKVAERCRELNPAIRVWTQVLDLEQQSAMPEVVEAVLSKAGRVDILVNNAGLSQRSLVKDTHFDVDRKLIEVNLLGTIALSKALLPHFLERKEGHFVVISSLMGKFGGPWRSSYAAAKHGLHGFFESLRAEVWSEGIHVTLICPGFVRTAVSLNALTADGTPLQQMDEKTAAGLSPEKFARKALRAIRRRSEEVYIGKTEVLGVWLKRYLPGVFSYVIRRAKVR